MDGFWVVEMKSPARGPRLGPNVHRCEKKRNLRGWEKRKKKGICGEKTQGFGPNLPLSEANLNIVEGVNYWFTPGNHTKSRLCFYGTCSTSWAWFRSHFVEMAIQTTKF
jgi:hypothetical protein